MAPEHQVAVTRCFSHESITHLKCHYGPEAEILPTIEASSQGRHMACQFCRIGAKSLVVTFLSGNGPVSVMFLDEPRNDQEDQGTLKGLPAPSDRYCSLRLSAVLGSLQRSVAS